MLGPACAILVRDPAALDALDDELRAHWQAIGGRVAVVRAAGSPPPQRVADELQLEAREDLLAAGLDAQQGVGLVARPDRYVFGVAGTPAALRELVVQLLARFRGEEPAA